MKATVPDSVAKVHSPLGPLFVAFRESGITYVALDRGEGDEAAFQRIKARLGRSVVPSTAPAWVERHVERLLQQPRLRSWPASTSAT